MKAKMACNEMYSVQKLKYVDVVKHSMCNIDKAKLSIVSKCMVFCSLIFTITTLIKWHDYAQTKAIHKAVMLNE